MSEQAAPDRLWSGIQVSKVVAGTCAAVAAAVLGSYLGVAGTLAGAALASVVGSVGTELFNNSLKRGTKRLQEVAPAFTKVPAAVGTPPVAAATQAENPAHTVVAGAGRKVRWGHVAVAASVLFALSMGVLSIVESVTDKPISATVRNTSGTGTSLFGGKTEDTGKKQPAPATSAEPTPEQTPDDGTSTPDPESSAPADPATDPPATTVPAEPTPTTVETTTQAPVAPEQPADPAQGQQGQETLPE
ncbi:hypothetical protein [Actinoplanes sp. NPDC051859]|uniref:hypothetical protein n=1 Tax=Actinoplanes sp. NPDC051859 TaxID=3363909 RepID=UPI0037A70318